MVHDLLLAVHGIGPAKADRALTRCGTAHTTTLAALSGRQQAALAQLLDR